jgi:hypothetical protein
MLSTHAFAYRPLPMNRPDAGIAIAQCVAYA